MNYFCTALILPGTSVEALLTKIKSKLNTYVKNYGKSGIKNYILYPQLYILCGVYSIHFLRSLILLEDKHSNSLLSRTLTYACQLKMALKPKVVI